MIIIIMDCYRLLSTIITYWCGVTHSLTDTNNIHALLHIPLLGRFFILKASEDLIQPIGLLPSGCAILHTHTQLFS
jgi:hypothetical protein